MLSQSSVINRKPVFGSDMRERVVSEDEFKFSYTHTGKKETPLKLFSFLRNSPKQRRDTWAMPDVLATIQKR